MIRIDENTYIDDTLVTCAEYQLFIDEMLEQGKYYQPDHWTSYKFPIGQAHAPIVGVRFIDAQAFCEWLNKREFREYSFRLPTSAEAEKFQIKYIELPPLGYWIIGSISNAKFFWIGSIPVNPRKLSHLDITSAFAHDHNLGSDLDRPLARALTRAFTSALVRPTDCDLDRNLDRMRTFTVDRDHDRALARPHALTIDRARVSALTFDRTLDHDLDLYIDIFTIQERIARRSPAFESIRLVKERKS